MTYTLKAQWLHEEESEYESLDAAVKDAQQLMRRHPTAFVSVQGEGVNFAVERQTAEVAA